MRILHIAESAKGGVGTYLAEILPDQAARYGIDSVRAIIPAQHAEHVSGVDRRLLVPWRRPGRSITGLVTFARSIRQTIAAFRPDIIHAHSSIAGGVMRLLYGWHRPRFRIVYCPHGWAFDRRGPAFKNRLIERIERGFAPGADRIVVISAYEHHEALRIGIAPDRLALVLNGIGDRPPARVARWEDDRVKVLFVGRLDAQKGFDTLLDAVAPFESTLAVRVIGQAVAGPASVPRPHNTQIEYLGWRSLSEVATEIAAADVVAIPSRWEGFGLVALEAMRGGCAVVASDVGGLREIVVEGETGHLVAPNVPERLMRALTLHDRAEWRKMGLMGRARYKALFTARRLNDELASVYESLMPLHPAVLAQPERPTHA